MSAGVFFLGAGMSARLRNYAIIRRRNFGEVPVTGGPVGWGTPPPPVSVNNPFVFIGLGGGRRCKRVILLNLATEILESITYSVLCRASWQNPMTRVTQEGVGAASWYCFKVIVLGWILVGILWGNWVGFPI